MSFNWPVNGVNHAPAYQISGIPYLTGSPSNGENISGGPSVFDFPQVSKSITLSVVSAHTIYFAVTSNGFEDKPPHNSPHMFQIKGPNVVTLDIRTKKAIITTEDAAVTWSMCASLTPVTASQFPILTASNGLYAGVG